MGDAVEMKIKDQPVRIRLAPDAISVPTLNAEAARRIGLKPSMIGFIYVIGPEKIGFRTDNAAFRAKSASFNRRTAFSARQLTANPVCKPTHQWIKQCIDAQRRQDHPARNCWIDRHNIGKQEQKR
ncbi:hypothetical protein GGQ62_002297 [Polymorphobacter fuscus]|nr:hypothetical protein [Polymorphobacter fuscus]NJC09299.1 hypothetical protein [Polymorphobacter fuscus]